MLDELFHILTFRAGYNTTIVTLGVMLLGVASGLVGALTLLRKQALIGDALAHGTLPGVAGAFLLASSLGAWGIAIDPRSLPVLLLGAATTGVLGVVCVDLIVRLTRPRIPQDAAIGIVLSVFFGAGFVLLSHIQQLPSGNKAGLKTFILGQPAAMSSRDAQLLAIVASLAALVIVLLHKEFRLISFDEGFARAQGWPVAALDLAMMTLVVLVTVVGLQAVGVILVVALLIVPAAAARFWADRLGPMLIISAVLGGISGYLGAALSALAPRLPAGAIVVLIATALFILSALCAPRTGLLSRALAHASLSRRIRREHALRAIFEAMEHATHAQPVGTPPSTSIPLSALSIDVVSRSLPRLRREGLVAIMGHHLALTPAGLSTATAAVRNHRLWERYLLSRTSVDPAHVDRSADLVEHVLNPELIAQLSRELDDPHSLPNSPHPL